MQVLEKILEEIDNLYVDETDFGIECNMENRSDVACDNCYECIKEACKNIIRNHMNDGWIPVEEKVPDSGIYIFLSFTNFTLPMIGRYKKDSDGGAFYIGDEEETCVSQDLYVNAWRPLPKPYRLERSEE